MSTTPTMEQPEVPHHSNWCCILTTFVLSGGLCFFGVSLALQGDTRTGLVLLLSSGGLLLLSVCTGLGKFQLQEEDKATPATPDDLDDRPPSYRLSWRRSFMRRVRSRNDEDEEGAAGDGGGGGGGGRRWWQRRGKQGKEAGGGGGGGEGGEGRRHSDRSSWRGPDGHNRTSSCDSLLAGLCGAGGARGGAWDRDGQEGRCTQSLNNLLDPPSYQDALLHLDDDAIRKLRSEMCLPTAIT